MSQMTSRQRVRAALKRQDVDYVPCCPLFNPLTPQQRLSYGWHFPWGNSQLESVTYQVETLGVDAVVCVPCPTFTAGPGVSSKTWIDGNVIHKAYTTPAGQLHASVRYDEHWPHGRDIPFYSDFNIAHFIEPWLETPADLECLRHVMQAVTDADQLDEFRFLAREAHALADKYHLPTLASVGMGLTGMQHLVGAEQLCFMTIDQPGLVDAYLQFEHERNLHNIALAGELGADIIRRNGYYETADFYSPAMLEKFLRKRLTAEFDAIHDAGAISTYTIHTGIMPILDYLRGYNVDCFNYIDIAFHGVDTKQINDKLNKSSFWLGPSNTYHMFADNPNVVRQAVRDTFDAFDKTGLILAPSPSAHSIMPWENTLAMIDEWKKLR